MRQCSIKKAQNSEMRVRQDLKDIIAYCEQNGHRPALGSTMDLRINSIRQIINKRISKNIDASEFAVIMQKIVSYPTFEAHSKRLDKEKAAKFAKKQQELLEQKYNRISKIFPNVKLLCVLMGKEFYEQVLNAEVSTIGLKILSEQTSEFISKYKTSSSFKTRRGIDALFKFVGIGVTEKDIQDVYQGINRTGRKMRNAPSKNGLTLTELGYVFFVCSEVIRDDFIYLKSLFKYSNLAALCEKYLAGDVNGMLSELPKNLRNMYEFQQKYNMLDMPTDELLKAGRIFFERVKKEKENSDVVCYAHNYDKIKQIFPKLELLRLLWDEKRFERFVSKDVNSFAIKLIADRLDEILAELCGETAFYRQYVEMLLKYIGCAVTDMDIALIKSKDKKRELTPMKHGLHLSDLACLYSMDVRQVKDKLQTLLREIAYRFESEEVYQEYVEGKLTAKDSSFHKMLRLYANYSKQEEAQLLKTEMQEAGRALYEMLLANKQNVQ